jgi:hypothetical protein
MILMIYLTLGAMLQLRLADLEHLLWLFRCVSILFVYLFIFIPLFQPESEEETFDLNAFPDDPDSPTSSLAVNRGLQTQIAPLLSPTPMASGPTGNKSTADIVPFYTVLSDDRKNCKFCL